MANQTKSEKQQEESSLSQSIAATQAQTLRDVAKMEIIIENLRDRVGKLETKVLALLMIQTLNLAILLFVLTRVFDLASKVAVGR